MHAMNYQQIEKSGWQRFFDAISTTMEGTRIGIEVIGLDIGDQIEAESLPISGITYDPNDDALYFYAEDVDRHVGHTISSPREIYAQLGTNGLSEVVVMDSDDHKQIVRFRAPLELPPHIEDELTELRAAHGRVE